MDVGFFAFFFINSLEFRFVVVFICLSFFLFFSSLIFLPGIICFFLVGFFFVASLLIGKNNQFDTLNSLISDIPYFSLKFSLYSPFVSYKALNYHFFCDFLVNRTVLTLKHPVFRFISCSILVFRTYFSAILLIATNDILICSRIFFLDFTSFIYSAIIIGKFNLNLNFALFYIWLSFQNEEAVSCSCLEFFPLSNTALNTHFTMKWFL